MSHRRPLFFSGPPAWLKLIYFCQTGRVFCKFKTLQFYRVKLFHSIFCIVFFLFPEQMFGVSVRAESKQSCRLILPTKPRHQPQKNNFPQFQKHGKPAMKPSRPISRCLKVGPTATAAIRTQRATKEQQGCVAKIEMETPVQGDWSLNAAPRRCIRVHAAGVA